VQDYIWHSVNRAIALAAIVVMTPVLLLCGVSILLFMGRPVTFRQQRAGLHGHLFELIKFRTMLPARAQEQSDANRITRLGRILRETSLDELPTLFNIVRGDMLLVGPRPLLPEYTTRYTAQQRIRLEVKPGLTGWAQIKGRNRTSWEERFELDSWYVEHRSVSLDFRIMIKTIPVVISRKGIAHPGHPTMPIFGAEEHD
jgi:lipopolysaccharide/colanic/teichoic acid biosynthesis glycosyltransferase